MYDLEIAVPAETNNPEILERFVDFKKWGFQNVNNTKIKLFLLASNDNNLDCLKDGWPSGIDVEPIKTPYKHVAQRIHHYYSEIIKSNTAHWYMRVDEDSMTDIAGLMENLERLFDPDRDYHINCDIEILKENIEYRILSNLGYDWWYTHKKTYPPHDYETSVTSNAAIDRIFKNPTARSYFTLRKQFDVGHGDHGLCYAARMTKIHPTVVNFLTKEPCLYDFSSFGGHLNHIHYTGKEQNPCVYAWINSLDKTQLNLFAGQSFILNIKNNDENIKEWIKLNANQSVSLLTTEVGDEDQPPDCFPRIWGVTKTGELTIFMNDFEKNEPLIVFKNTKNGSLKCKNFQLSLMDNSL